MSRYSGETRVLVHPHSRQADADEVVVGREGVFLALPRAAVELLDLLSEQKTVGEAQAIYQQAHNETPDMEDFLVQMEQAGFVRPLDGLQDAAAPTRPQASVAPTGRYHFEGFPQPLASALVSWPALSIYGFAIMLAMIAIATDPSLLPRWNALLFTKNFTLMGVSLLAFTFVRLFVHELAHLVAARAVNVPARIGFGHRLWMLVAETDVSGLWAVPRSARYMTFLAGPLTDLVSASLLMLVLFAAKHHSLPLSAFTAQYVSAIVLMYLLNLTWQGYFYIKTDFYFVFANFFGCKNLMGDTVDFLRYQFRRLSGLGAHAEPLSIPVAEMRVVRWYSLFWIAGRVIAFWVLFTVAMPLWWSYATTFFHVIFEGKAENTYARIDAIVTSIAATTIAALGFWMWIRSMFLKHRKQS